MRSLVGVVGACACVCVCSCHALVERSRRTRILLSSLLFPTTTKSTAPPVVVGRTDGHEVVLVGGSTRIPKVRAQLKKHFGGREPSSAVHPDEARLDLSSYDD